MEGLSSDMGTQELRRNQVCEHSNGQTLVARYRSLQLVSPFHLLGDLWLLLIDVTLLIFSADERLEERRECDARVMYDGTVMWHPMAIYKSTCPVHIKYFPFDKQACHLKFGPWTYDG